MMSDILLIYHSRSGDIYVIDPDDVPFSTQTPQILDIGIAILNAGYKGVALDEKRLMDGRYFVVTGINLGTHEGVYMGQLMKLQDEGQQLPTSDEALNHIDAIYKSNGGSHE